MPPDAENTIGEYATPTIPAGSGEGVVIVNKGIVTGSVKLLEEVCAGEALSVTCTATV